MERSTNKVERMGELRRSVIVKEWRVSERKEDLTHTSEQGEMLK